VGFLFPVGRPRLTENKMWWLWISLFLSSLFKTTLMSAIENTSDQKVIRIDFAPMVDLGFLLITFFIFTTSLMEPKAFGLHVPDDGEGVLAPLSATITLTLLENGRIDYLEGNDTHVLAKGSTHLYQQQSLRKHLLEKRNRIIEQLGSDEQYTVIIQPTAQTNYKEIVDVLDEMTITGIKKYVLMSDKAIY
jgi:biopolymer transport protein ExbD